MRIHALLLGAVLAAFPSAARTAPAPEEAPEAGVLTRAPELIAFVPAEYPPDAEAAGIEGSVELSIVIDVHGEVHQAVVVDPGPHPGFAPAALHAVQQFRFRPAEIDGKPAPVEIAYRYDFVLRRATPPPPAESPVVLAGRVIERGTRTPVAGASIDVGGVATETDADGRFSVRGVAPGPAPVRIVSPEHETFTVTETIEAGKRLEVEYRLSRRSYDPYEAVVRGERPRREVSVHTLEVEEIRTIAGTQGDTLKVLQNLPGVARSPFGIGLLVVRGSEPTETNVYLDGIPVPLLFHFGGITSVVSSDVIESLEFLPGNFATRYGRALGGTVDLRTREGRDAFHGSAQLDVFDGRVELEGPVAGGTGFLAVRRSWVDAVLAVVLPRVAPDTASELRVAPRYWDYQAKYSHPLLGGTLSLLGYGSDDKLEFVDRGESSGRPTFYLSTVFHRVGARWRRAIGPARNDLVVALGRDSFDVLQSSNFGVLSELRSLTLRDALTWRVSERLTLEAGVDAILRSFDYSIYAPPMNAPGSIDQQGQERPEATVGESTRGSWLAPAGYVEADLRATARLRLVAGVRLDGDSRLRGRKTWLDPRLSAFYDLREGTTLTAAAGLFGSAPQVQDLTETFGNPNLGAQHGLHLSLGARQALPWSARLELTGFYKRLRDLVVPTRATDAAGNLEQLSNGGRGRALGIEVLLRRELARGLFGWLSYTWSRSDRRDDPTMPSYPEWHPFPLDQRHILALVLSYRLRGDWILGTRVRGVSGNPYTPFEGSVYDADSGRYQCIPGPSRYSRRLPGFFQADARLDKRFVFRSWMMSVYVDVQNVTNRENAEFRFPSYDCSETVAIPSVPVLPALGLRAEW
ncbi:MULTISPECIES: TonB-dependent receptor domain-containing protein [Anaeromyxobacter]|uniref:TonB-dependent receptor domain-containing protein n=1 Tax=Anaeromyxobacter TaxID=161492 RepID=UPI001F5751CB|nr:MULTISPECIES: TonB-dependent receptor [unclassified Anaeromyxobacter]